MSEPAAPSSALFRYAAVALSFGLAGLVVVNAQFGCDAKSGEDKAAAPEEAKAAAPDETKAGDAKAAAGDSPAAPAEDAQPPANEADSAAAAAAPAAGDSPAVPAEKRVLMPASKSGGDFGGVPFPGEKAGVLPPAGAEQAQETHEANQAPQQQQQANQAPQP